MVKHLGVVGAGTMGSGLAQLAALAGIEVSLYDINGTVLRQALERIKTRLKSRVDSGELTEEQQNEALGRLHPRTRLAELNHSDIVVEAVIEELRIKKDLFRHLEADTKPTTLLASTSFSHSITAIASSTHHPEKVLGLHFLNPAGSGRLVEIVRGERSSEESIQRAISFAGQLNKTSVVVQDTPGFIVNRLLEPFYGESLKILGEKIADCQQIDRIMRTIGGFELGPLESMDETGLDICLATAESLYSQTSGDPRHRPHVLLKQKVDSGMLGKKTGGGFYIYNTNEKK
jgi:3-hydroxybutyryl-CoA dehydrogenase